MNKGFGFLFCIVTVVSVLVGSEQSFSETPKAKIGGAFQMNLSSEPTTLNPITGTDLYNYTVERHVLDYLLVRNLDTFEWEPGVAEKWVVSKDGREFTFTLRKNAKWSDGQMLTAEDVKFTFDAIMNDAFKTAHLRPYYENIERADVIDTHTVKFTTKNRYFGNFDMIAAMSIWAKHVYGDPEKALKMNKTMFGSGPYVLKEYNQGLYILLERNPNWWGWSASNMNGRYNFQSIRMRFNKEENLVLERLKKGELDFDELTTEAFAKKTDGAPWGATVLKTKVESKTPKGYRYVGWNLTKDMFMDVKTRKALAHLMNREEMNKKFSYGMSLLASGPWYRQSRYANPLVRPVEFDPKKAMTLLKEAGWADSNQDGVLDRKGQPFEFSLFYANKDMQKYWVMYQEDMRKAGIKMNLQLLEWNALLKNLDERKFDAVALGWGGGTVDLDPKGIWHSDSRVAGGSNRTGYSNPAVDKLIDEARVEFDKTKREKIYHRVYQMIADDAPVAFLFNEKYELYASTSRVAKAKPNMNYSIGSDFWWLEN